MKGLLIESVSPGSTAEELGAESGDILVAVNGHLLRDVIDYSYHTSSDQELLLEIAKPDGEIWELEIERQPGEPLGLYFHPPKPTHCKNNCLFCFVHQLPKGLRKPLYVKDEDYRLSFLNGNYVTLANLRQSELARITGQRLSPLYISVHATNPDLREKLLGRNGIPPIMEQLQRLADARIAMHTQVVLCPGINDGAELERTVTDLAQLYPAVQSLAIVPLGLTQHRHQLPQLQPVDQRYARAFISVWEQKAKKLRKQLGEPFLFLADEFYLKAELPFPQIREYGDFPQLENGVGMVPLFRRDASRTLKIARHIGDHAVTVFCGKSAASFVSEFTSLLTEKTGVRINTVGVENRLFGSSVTVTGLVSGRDIIAAMHGQETGQLLMVPDVMLKEGEGMFLDDLSIADLESALGCPVVVFEASPEGFYKAMKTIK
jgi:putative radical SAM enzyme (TIGR03279 family)